MVTAETTASSSSSSVMLMPPMPRLLNLNVTCERNGMTVRLQFDRPFNGVVFSKGYYGDPQCRYVNADGDSAEFTFVIPSMRCGSSTPKEAERESLENTIIIQFDKVVQSDGDLARKLRCDWPTHIDRTVTFRPVAVAPLEVQELRFEGEAIACWMDVHTGDGPFTDSVDTAVQVGETLSLVIYARDRNGTFDLQVKECYASSSPEFNSAHATTVQLTDSLGCPLRPKLMGHFFRTRETRRRQASILAFALINAFRFPDTDEVYMACNVAVCKGSCPASCIEDLTDPTNQLGLTPAPPQLSTEMTSKHEASIATRGKRHALLSLGHVNLQHAWRISPHAYDHLLCTPVVMAVALSAIIQLVVGCALIAFWLRCRDIKKNLSSPL